MANIILFDSEVRGHLLPLTFTRPVAELRVGILTIREKWERWLHEKVSYITQDHLAEQFPLDYGSENLVINGSVLPSEPLCRLLWNMDFSEAYLLGDELIVAKLDNEQLEKLINDEEIEELRTYQIENIDFLKVNYLWDLYRLNAQALEADFHMVTAGRHSQPISHTNRVLGSERIFIEEGAIVECATLNAQTGPIYIGCNAQVMEGSMVRGPVSIGEHSFLKMGARVYGPTSIGPWCKVGGEVDSVIFQGRSNKAHEGFMGHSVIGEWCNIGAGTSVSNLKNDYSEVKLWTYSGQRFLKSGLTHGGLILGDHSRIGINVMINSGTSIGVGCNIYGSGYPRNYVPSFTMGGAQGFQTNSPEQVIPSIERMMQRRHKELTVKDRLAILRLYEETAAERTWEK